MPCGRHLGFAHSASSRLAVILGSSHEHAAEILRGLSWPETAIAAAVAGAFTKETARHRISEIVLIHSGLSNPDKVLVNQAYLEEDRQ